VVTSSLASRLSIGQAKVLYLSVLAIIFVAIPVFLFGIRAFTRGGGDDWDHGSDSDDYP
jgi:hypothetical protein